MPAILPATFQNPSRVRFGVFGFICTLSLLTYLDRVCIMRVQGDIQHDLGLTAEQMGWVFSAFLIGYGLFEIPGGWMGDVWGPRKVLTRIVIWWSAFTALTGLVPALQGSAPTLFGMQVPLWVDGFLLLVGVRFLFGCGEAGAYPNIARVVGSWFPYNERGLAQGGVWMSARLGGAIAPVVIGQLSRWLGWREAFWILGAVGLAWCIVFWYWFRDTPEEMDACNAAERDLIRAGQFGAHAKAGHSMPPFGMMIGSVTMWALCVAGAGVSFGWYFYPTWQPVFLKEQFGISFADSEILTGLPFLCGAAGSIIGGKLSDYLIYRTGSRRWGRSLLGLFGFSGAGVCVVLTGQVVEAWQAVFLLCLAFFINDVAIPVIWAVSSDVGGRYAGTVAGVMNTAGAIGAVISPALTPVLRNSFPWPVIFMVLSGGWFVAALAWLWIDASKPLFPEPPAEPEPPPPLAPIQSESIQAANEHVRSKND